jgi:hypothetical protein
MPRMDSSSDERISIALAIGLIVILVVAMAVVLLPMLIR